jgi:hypothetical protein
MALPTPAQVKNLPLSAALKAIFAAVDDAAVQTFIDNCASAFGSSEVKRHSRRDEAVLYGAAHLLWLALYDEGAIPGGGGGGGGVGVLSGVTLVGVGSKSFAVQALTPAQESDWLVRKSPFSTKLHMILETFPPGIATANWPCGGPPSECC